MSEHGADPVERFNGNLVGFAGAAYMAVEGVTHVRELRARQRAEHDERAAAAARAQMKAALGRARATWSIILEPHTREAATLKQTGEAWAAAQPWRADTPDAQRASDLAEDRLRVLRPVAMDRYDRLRAEGHNPVDAMWQVTPLMDRPPRSDAHIPREPLPQNTDLHAVADPMRYQPDVTEANSARGARAGHRGAAAVAVEDYPVSLHAAAAAPTARPARPSTPAASAAAASRHHHPKIT